MKRDYVTNVRVNREEKEQVDEILQGLGLNFSAVITLLMKQIILSKGVPFPIVMPQEDTVLSIEGKETCDAVDMQVVDGAEVVKDSLPEEQDVDSNPMDEKEDFVSDIVADSTSGELTHENRAFVSEYENAGEVLFTEQSKNVDFESMVDDVSILETSSESSSGDKGTIEPYLVEENISVNAVTEVSEDVRISGEEKFEDFSNVFDAFQSMDI